MGFRTAAIVVCAGGLSGCIASTDSDLDDSLRSHLDAHRYREAMWLLPKAMEQWQAERTSAKVSIEGADSFLSGMVIDVVTRRGDKDWGAILDDPMIELHVKAQLMFSIIEERAKLKCVYDPELSVMTVEIPKAASP